MIRYQILDPLKNEISDIRPPKKIKYQISHPLKNQISNIWPQNKNQISDITPPNKSNIRYLGTPVPPPPPPHPLMRSLNILLLYNIDNILCSYFQFVFLCLYSSGKHEAGWSRYSWSSCGYLSWYVSWEGTICTRGSTTSWFLWVHPWHRDDGENISNILFHKQT